MPRDTANCHGVSQICFVNFSSSSALNRFARVEIASALLCIALGIHAKSLDTDFLSHSAPHFTRALPYFAVLLAIQLTAGIATFSSKGHATAPHTIPVAISPPVGSLHSLTAVYVGVPTAP